MDKTNPTYYSGDACMRKIAEVTASLSGAEAFCIGQAMKYIWRAGRKDGESESDDLGKAQWYLDWKTDHGKPSGTCTYLLDKLLSIGSYTAPELFREKIMALSAPEGDTSFGPYVGERGYLDLLYEVLTTGERRKNRTGVDTLSLFGPQISFDLRERFPIFTTKKVWWKGVAVELDWMLQGTGDVAYLQQHGVKIWDAWAKADYRPELGLRDGHLGRVYGVQWRHWGAPRMRYPVEAGGPWHDGGQAVYGVVDEEMRFYEVDQIAQIIRQLRRRASGEVHSDDRRILLNSWNVAEIDRMKLPPCHYGAQFLVDNDLGLTCIVSIRSWDLFLGAPFNVAQYALLTHILAHLSGLIPRRLVMNAGDAHIYVNHIEQVTKQIDRTPSGRPHLVIHDVVKEIDDFRFDLCSLTGYEPQGALPGEVAV